MNIVSHFLEVAKNTPDKIAIIDSERSVTFRELEKEVIATAAYFRSAGIAKGDRVLVFIPMSIDLYRVVLALFYCGATAVFIDEWVSMSRLRESCKIADCKGFIGIFKARFFSLFIPELRKIRVKLSLGKRGQSLLLTQVQSDDSALITFTTGSTGPPKAANRTHDFLNEQLSALIQEIDPQKEDVDLVALPIVLFMNLGFGCTSIIPKFSMKRIEKMNFDTIIRQLQDHQVSRITASPFFVDGIARRIIQTKTELSALKKIFTGGAPVFPKQAALFNQAFSETEITVVYGSTEAEPISSIGTRQLFERRHELRKGLPVGTLYSDIELRIITISDKAIPNPDDFAAMCMDERETGEIIVSGRHVLKSYFNSPDAFKNSKITVGNDVWHRTGDSGFMENGELYLTGRCTQLIRKNHRLLSPLIVENLLLEIEGIAIGTVMDVNGSIIVAVESETITREQILPQLASVEFDDLRILAKIPRDPRHHSKIDYPRLLGLLTA